ncbi:MAG: ion channel [Acidobacteriota bacterium]
MRRMVGLDRLAAWRGRVREPALTVLLAFELLVIFVLVPLDGLSVFAPRSFQVLIASLVVVAAVALIASHRGALVLTLLAAVVGLVADAFRYEWPSDFSTFAFLLVVLAFLFVLTGVIGRVVFGSGRVSAHRIQGAVVIYLHMAVIFTYLQAVVLFFAPGALGDGLTATDPAVGARLLYFSFTTLTTVGYGDIVPVHPFARSLANLEAIVGQLYPATLLARLVTLEISSRQE